MRDNVPLMTTETICDECQRLSDAYYEAAIRENRGQTERFPNVGIRSSPDCPLSLPF